MKKAANECPTCHRPYDELDQLLEEPDEDGQGPTLQTIVDRLAKRAAKERYRNADGYAPRDYTG